MPPRYAFWTILIDDKPTAFRARDRAELLPTFNQLQRKNPNIVMRWFARGRLWESPEAEREAQRRPAPPREHRGPAWRPGGRHEDPRQRFKSRGKDRGPKDRPTTDRRPHGGGPKFRPEGGGPKFRPETGGAKFRPKGAGSKFRPQGAGSKFRPQGGGPKFRPPNSAPGKFRRNFRKPKPPKPPDTE